jgi:hypothetical protein
MKNLFVVASIGILCVTASVSRAQVPAPPQSWLDRPLVHWNRGGERVPRAKLTANDREAKLKECALTLRRSTPAERAVADAGWIPFLNYGRPLVEGDVEVIGGMAGSDGMCRPTDYNIFVFVGGRFAGTLSPQLMVARIDSQLGEARIADRNTLSATFARYTDKDPLCCPSSEVIVTYRIDRASGAPIVVPQTATAAAR